MWYQASWWVTAPAVRALFRMRTEGREHLPKKGPAILASNHLSFLDHLVLGSATRRQIFFISKVEHFDFRFRRFLFERWGVIPLRRGAGDQEAFEKSREVLQRGDLFAIYPEGTRSLDGKLHRGHTGVARLHLMTGAPVIPVAMIGTFEALPKGRSLPKLKKCIARFGPPLRFDQGRDRADDRAVLRAVTDKIMAAIRDLSGQAYVDEYQRNPEVRGHASEPSAPGRGPAAPPTSKPR